MPDNESVITFSESGTFPTEAFLEHRPYCFAIAYRMLGSVADAEDILQEAFLRWQAAAPRDLHTPRAYLATIVTRLCLDHLGLARVKREHYVGSWIPEPLETNVSANPEAVEIRNESISLALLVLLERLSPVERAVVLLHDVFAYEYGDIAPIVDRSLPACRQLARRARRRLQAPLSQRPVSPGQHEALIRAFAHACASGDVSMLKQTLADDITVIADGGGKAPAARHPLHGATSVAPYLLGIMKHMPAGAEVRTTIINGAPGFVVMTSGTPFSVMALDITDDRIGVIWIITNPDKFAGITM